MDLNQDREDVLTAPLVEGAELVSERFAIPGYPAATAKLTIKRAHHPFERETPRFRLGGILVKSRYAIHEATLFDSSLENDMYAQHFFGRLVCEKVDELWNDYDERFEGKKEFATDNPVPLIDPSRKTGFLGSTMSSWLFSRKVTTRPRPLADEERKREESKKASVENVQTRRRLNELEKAASEFLRDYSAEDDVAADPNRQHLSLKLKLLHYYFQPPFSLSYIHTLYNYPVESDERRRARFCGPAAVSNDVEAIHLVRGDRVKHSPLGMMSPEDQLQSLLGGGALLQECACGSRNPGGFID